LLLFFYSSTAGLPLIIKAPHESQVVMSTILKEESDRRDRQAALSEAPCTDLEARNRKKRGRRCRSSKSPFWQDGSGVDG